MLLQELRGARVWDAVREMDRLQAQLNRLLSGDRFPSFVEYPPVNVWTSENAVIVTSEIPGIDIDQIDVSVVNQTLTLRGERRGEELSDREQFHRRERGCGQFSRTIELPFRVDVDNVSARFARGILTIELPRASSDKPRRVSVTTA